MIHYYICWLPCNILVFFLVCLLLFFLDFKEHCFHVIQTLEDVVDKSLRTCFHRRFLWWDVKEEILLIRDHIWYTISIIGYRSKSTSWTYLVYKVHFSCYCCKKNCRFPNKNTQSMKTFHAFHKSCTTPNFLITVVTANIYTDCRPFFCPQ